MIISTKLKEKLLVNDSFKMDVLLGLSASKKQIPAKYFYDKTGAEIFNKITEHPDYYLTQCELKILHLYKKKLSNLLKDKPLNIIELGPGDGSKACLLIQQLLDDGLQINYSPVDIASEYLDKIQQDLSQQFPNLNISPHCTDYLSGNQWATTRTGQRNIVLFFGSTIGNLAVNETKLFLKNLWRSLRHDDYVLIGFDLRKDLDILMRAYNDDAYLTRNFNLNLLHRINRELGGNFAVHKFRHFPSYNVHTGAMESYLVSIEAQTVYIEALKQSFTFLPFEAIHVESSYKYLLSQIADLATNSGFEIVDNFIDSQQYFTDSLWKVNK